MSTSVELYATEHGARYHADPYCDGLSSWWANSERSWAGSQLPPIITRTTARRRRLKPCAVCKPTPLLTIVSSS